jgi:hypothetical protein
MSHVTCGTYDGRSRAKRALGKPEGKRALVRPWSRWEDNIKMNLQEVGCGMDGINTAKERERWRDFELCDELSGSIKCDKFLGLVRTC